MPGTETPETNPFPLELTIEPMEAKAVDQLPADPLWQFEPKWDGFRCLAFKGGGEVDLRAKSGKPLSRYFPEIMAALKAAPATDFVLDGELAIPLGDTLSFDALQARIHPAQSRIARLSVETPAVLILFDCLAAAGQSDLMQAPLEIRRQVLESVVSDLGPEARTRLTPFTRDLSVAERWLEKAQGALDGVIAKRVYAPYEPGERTMMKVKLWRSADCVVGGFRYAQNAPHVGSLLLGLHDASGKLNHVGFTSSFSRAERIELTEKLEPLKGGPGFTGDAPGAPSRWSNERSTAWEPLRSELVVEVSYDHVTGGRFRHGTKLLRWRPDKAPRQCTMEQLEEESRPGLLIKDVLSNGTS